STLFEFLAYFPLHLAPSRTGFNKRTKMEQKLVQEILQYTTDDDFVNRCFQVSTIKDELKRRGLEQTGSKEECIQRLITANLVRTEDSNEQRVWNKSCSNVLESSAESETDMEHDNGDTINANVVRRRNRLIREIREVMRGCDRSDISEVNSETQRPMDGGMNVTLHTTPDLSGTIANYTGKRNESFRMWCESLENAKSQCNWGDSVVRGIAISRLRGEAKCWQSYEGKDINDWTQWKKALKLAFDKPLTMREWNQMVNDRRQQSGETVAEYMSEKMALISRAPNEYKIGKEAAIDYLISGVADRSIRRVFRIREYTSIHSLIESARTMDRDTEDLDKDHKSNEYNRSDKWSNDIKRIERKKDEVFPKRVNTDKHTFENRRKTIVCYRCNNAGHIASECPEKSNTREQAKAVTNCILESKYPTKAITIVDAKVFGKVMDVMVDSGCERTVIKRGAIPEGTNIDVTDGQKLKVVENEVTTLGSTLVNIGIGGFIAQVSAAVVD
ncbi:blastopia polyprotein-like protein, partial [Leptotrombidium deliense]